MKKFEIRNFVSCVVLMVLTTGFAAGSADAKIMLPRRTKSVPAASVSEKTVSSHPNVAQASGEVSPPDSDPVSMESAGSGRGQGAAEKPEKKNPILEFFGGIGRKKPKSEVKLPSEGAVPSSEIAGVPAGNGEKFEYPETKGQKPPFEPSYGVDRTSETNGFLLPESAAAETTASGIPDAVILEDAPPQAPILAQKSGDSEFGTANLKAKTAISDGKDGVLEDVSAGPAEAVGTQVSQPGVVLKAMEDADSENSEVQLKLEGFESETSVEAKPSESANTLAEEMPPVPTTTALKGMNPDEALNPNSEIRSETLKNEKPDSSASSWNREIPQLEFMEKKNEPILNVSPQRLASPVGQRNFSVRSGGTQKEIFGAGEKEGNEIGAGSSENLDPPPLESSVEVKGQVGSGVTISPSAKSSGTETSQAESARAELRISTQAPESILVGVESQFLIVVWNASEVVSEGSLVEVEIPEWFSVSKAAAEKGSAGVLMNAVQEGQRCVWNVGTLLPNERETLRLSVIPRQSASADFHVSWSNRKAEKMQTVVAEAPQLEMKILLEERIPEGVQTPLRIRVANVGNCIAKDVALLLDAEGCDPPNFMLPGIHRLLPGEEQTVEVKIQPATREPMKLHAEAKIQNQNYASTEYVAKVDYVDLKLETPVTESSFAGMETKFPVKITNEGNVTAQNVKMSLELPPQVRVESSDPPVASDFSETNRLLILNLKDLPGGASQEVLLWLRPLEEGNVEIPLTVQADSKIMAEKTLSMRVDGVASARMELKFPKRVLARTENAFYEVQVTNTGSRIVSDAKLFIFFADGIEPQMAEQTAELMTDGVVSFNVPPIAPGESQSFRVQARAAQAGNFPIRCQLKSEDGNLDLIQQETSIYR